VNDHSALLDTFYRAFQARDGAAMAACYHPGGKFSDPVFPDLSAREAGAMWQMLCRRGKDLRVEYRILSANAQHGQVRWEAWYTFSASGRPVHNQIDASFEFRDGKIFRHRDDFDFPRWAAQALGFKGWLLGRTRFLQGSVQKSAAKSLNASMARAETE